MMKVWVCVWVCCGWGCPWGPVEPAELVATRENDLFAVVRNVARARVSSGQRQWLGQVVSTDERVQGSGREWKSVR
jgi:hypothetical protein